MMLVLPPCAGVVRAAVLRGRSCRLVEPPAAAANRVRPDPDAGRARGLRRGRSVYVLVLGSGRKRRVDVYLAIARWIAAADPASENL